ncbi:MAG: hypothetical protein IJE05_04970 [Clostridia bacterium]|nr:hypothetical protein [Clostridia bacterium]
MILKREKRHFVTNEEQEFLENALRALENKPKEGYRWLPVFEPSADGKGGLQFVRGEKPKVGFDCYKWQKLMTEYSPENESGKCSIHTYFLLQLRWLKEGIVTLEQLADDSKDIGHYRDSENAKHDVELTGQREFGGLYGLIGNTWKMLGDPNSKFGFSVVGGDCYDDGKEHPAADVFRIRNSNFKDNNTVGLLELKK